MTEAVNKKTKVNDPKQILGKQLLISFLAKLFIAYILSGLSISQEIFPFGTAMIFNLESKEAPFAALAGILGIWSLSKTEYKLKYFASMLTALTLRVIFSRDNGYGKLINSLLAAISSLFPSLIMIILADKSLYRGIMAIIEGILAAGNCYFFSMAKESFCKTPICSGKRSNISAVFFICVLSMALMNINIFKINFGLLFSMLIICVFSSKGEGSSCLIASALSAAFIIIRGESSVIPLLFIMSGLFSGIFSKVGKLSVCGANIITAFLMIFSFKKPEISYLTGSIIGAVIYLFIPKQYIENFMGGVRVHQENSQIRYICMIVKNKLMLLSEALCEIKKTVNTVSAIKSKYNMEKYDVIYDTVCERACKYCPNYSNCWQKNYTVTTDIIRRVVEKLKKNKKILLSDYPEYFKDTCNSYIEISDAVEEGFNLYLINKKNQREIHQVRTVITEQLQGISDMIIGLSESIDNIYRSDLYLQDRVLEYFKKKKIFLTKCFCFYDKNDVITLEIELPLIKKEIALYDEVILDLSEICGRNLTYPQVIAKEDKVNIIYIQEAVFKTEVAYVSHCGEKEDVCGDSILQFESSKSISYTILSDGMSTGKTASIQAVMTTDMLYDLISRGAEPESSIKIINSALMCKSSSECMSTVDITAFDLYTGEAKFYKSATPPTYILRGGRAMSISSGSLPLGIIKSIEPQTFSLKLKAGDIIVNVSDGATESGDSWINSELEYLAGNSAQEIAEALYKRAIERKSSLYLDDISIAVMKIVEN